MCEMVDLRGVELEGTEISTEFSQKPAMCEKQCEADVACLG